MGKICKFWRRHFLYCELILALLIATGIWVWLSRYGGYDQIDALLDKNRSVVYGTLASIYGALLGFTIASAAIVLGHAQSEELRVVRESCHYQTLWKVFLSTIRFLGFSTIVALFALIFDRPNQHSRIPMIMCIFGFLISALRLGRTIWVLENIIHLVTKPSPSGY